MKKYLFIITACSLFFSCHHPQEEVIPEEPEQEYPYPDEMPCSFVGEWTQEETICNRELPWDYPAKPGTEEWYELRGFPAQEAACQIPEDILSSLSTGDLAEICRQYPLRLYSLTFDSHEQFLNALFRTFNGIHELFQREVLQELLNQYRCLVLDLPFKDGDISAYQSLFERLYFKYSFGFWKLILTRYHSPDDTKEDYMEIMQHLAWGYEKQIMYPVYPGSVFFPQNIYARARILAKIDENTLFEKISQKDRLQIFQSGNMVAVEDAIILIINKLT